MGKALEKAMALLGDGATIYDPPLPGLLVEIENPKPGDVEKLEQIMKGALKAGLRTMPWMGRFDVRLEMVKVRTTVEDDEDTVFVLDKIDRRRSRRAARR